MGGGRGQKAGGPAAISWSVFVSFNPSQTMSEPELAEITERQAAEQRAWQGAAAEGYPAECLGKEFLVMPGIFPPREDSRLLIESLEIKPGDVVLDLGTGSGVLAVFAALKGAGKVIAVDWNEDAVENAKLNAEKHGVETVVEARVSNVFSAIGATEIFDVIVANLPARNKPAPDLVSAAQWDTGYQAHKTFFATAQNHLQAGGKIFMVTANYPEIADLIKLAEQVGLKVDLAAEKAMPDGDPRIYYALVMTPA